MFNKDGATATYKQAIKLAIGNMINKEPRARYEHKIYAMDNDNGKIKWKTSLGEGMMVSNNKSGAPMLYNPELFTAQN